MISMAVGEGKPYASFGRVCARQVLPEYEHETTSPMCRWISASGEVLVDCRKGSDEGGANEAKNVKKLHVSVVCG